MNILKLGSIGTDVVTLQRALNAHGVTIAVDGYFGENTALALRQFQASRQLMSDGIAGPQTFAALATLIPPPPRGLHVWDGSSIVPGVDTSHYQNPMQLKDWQQLRAAGFAWVYPKAVDGLSPDDYFIKSKQLALEAGFIVFAGYAFNRFNHEAKAQAEFLVKTTGGVKSGECPLVIDNEWSNTLADRARYGDGHMMDGPAEEHIYTYLSTVEDLTGVTPWHYTSAGFFRASNNPDRFLRFPAIIANYDTRKTDGAISVPKGLHMVARQYSGTLRTARGTQIDADHFLGTLSQLQTYVKK